MMCGTEPWVYDILRALDKIEQEHDSDQTCMGPILALAPMVVRNESRAITSYLAATADNVKPVKE